MITFIFIYLSLGTGIVTSISVTPSEKLRTFVPGQTIVLSCMISEFNEKFYSWFRQSLGEAPSCIVTFFAGPTVEFYEVFKYDKRFTAEIKLGNQFTLTITDTMPNDTGIYYCAVQGYNNVVFGDGVILKYEGPDLKHQHYIKEVISLDKANDSWQLKESLHPGDNVTLHCTVLSQGCEGEHSVYWFRHGSGESHPGIIYSHGNSRNQCKNRTETGLSTQSCVYSLPKKNLSDSDAGTYYCAVAMCGKILFGNGSKIELTDKKTEYITMYWSIVGLATLNSVCIIIIAILLCALTKYRNMTHETRAKATTFQAEESPFITENVETEDRDYAALKFSAKKSNKQKTQKDTQSNIIYSSVRVLD